MSATVKVFGKEYKVESLSDSAKADLKSYEFASERLQELNRMQLLLQEARNSFINRLKQEMISNKAGFFIGDN